ncbi:PREDICTED: probable inactive receptor kinase At2g26730 [Ipomoea nil]|uniref:probable inactive receptor kinase At2g26730 n=1 Tax=Ipomoea nil TaxID=35883 RepID=UPI000900DB05|nr:PREDICTED: probable inactive receptor kinase At2g26730 [Ipomoea nil]
MYIAQIASSSSSTCELGMSTNQILMFTGYFLIGVALFLALTLWLRRNGKKKNKKEAKNGDEVDESGLTKPREQRKSESGEVASESMVVVGSGEVKGLRFEELLKAPAELLGRGKHGSVYKVMCENPRMSLTVQRIKEWGITGHDFKKRMQRLRELKHPNVMPALAFYSSSLEKLLVYEYQQNGSLLTLVQGIQMGKAFDWSRRLSIAGSIADTLAFMHKELKEDGIAHGNFKSSNIMFNQNMEPCISEYGLMPLPAEAAISETQQNPFKQDIYGLGVILLELLTGKMNMMIMAQNNGQEDLASWVLGVLREEWTVEVFDRALIQEGASEGRIVGLLQVAVKCVNPSPEARPSIHQVATMIRSIQEQEERSMDSSQSITM